MADDLNNNFNISDYLTGPIPSIGIPLLSAIAGAARKIPTRFGFVRAGLGGGLEGGLQGLGAVNQFQEQGRKLNEQRRMSELLGDKGYFAEQIPTGKQRISGIVPKVETDPGAMEEESFALKPELTPEMAPRMDTAKRKMYLNLPEPVRSATLGHLLTQEDKPLPLRPGGSIAIRDPSQPSGYRFETVPGAKGLPFPEAQQRLDALGNLPPGVKYTIPTTEGGSIIKETPREVSPFARPPHPTIGKTAESIARYRATITPENPYGDETVLKDRPEIAEKNKAELERIKAQTARANQAVAMARDPSVATVGQLASGIQSLTRAAEFSEDDNEASVMRDARRVLIDELAARRNRPKGPSPTQPSGQSPSAPGLPPGLPAGSKPFINPSTGQHGTSNGKPIYVGPDGKKYLVE